MTRSLAKPKPFDLRDQIAAHAMAALIHGLKAEHREAVLDGTLGGKRISHAAYMYADAMMEARDA